MVADAGLPPHKRFVMVLALKLREEFASVHRMRPSPDWWDHYAAQMLDWIDRERGSYIDAGRTHYDGCWKDRGHHNCAIDYIARIEGVMPTESASGSPPKARATVTTGPGLPIATPAPTAVLRPEIEPLLEELYGERDHFDVSWDGAARVWEVELYDDWDYHNGLRRNGGPIRPAIREVSQTLHGVLMLAQRQVRDMVPR